MNLKQKLKENKNLLIVFIIIVVLALVYYWFFTGEGSFSSQLFQLQERTEASEIGRALREELNRLRALDSVNLDVLHDPAVANMEDISLRIIPEPLGRSNPFAPF